MVISPYGNNIIDGGAQERKYANSGYIIVSNQLCKATYDNVKQLIREHIKNHNLQEVAVPDDCKLFYIDAIHELVEFPYAKYLLSKSFIKSQYAKLRKRQPDYYKKNGELVYKYKPSDYHIMKITDYFTEAQRMQCAVKSSKSPSEVFKNKNYLRRILSGQKVLSSAIIREEIWKTTKECTLFKNTLVVDICKYYKAKSYLDISAGWGDRLIGALAAGVDKYVGYDPNTNLKKGHRQIQTMFDTRNVSTIHYEPFQTANVPANSFDLVLSSPPYFDFESYTSLKSQSDKTFQSLDTWLNGFLFVSLHKAWVALKQGGNMIIHIGDVSGYNIVSPMIAFMKSLPGSSNVEHVYVEGGKGKLRRMYHMRKSA